jgi:hypothetical protein
MGRGATDSSPLERKHIDIKRQLIQVQNKRSGPQTSHRERWIHNGGEGVSISEGQQGWGGLLYNTKVRRKGIVTVNQETKGGIRNI